MSSVPTLAPSLQQYNSQVQAALRDPDQSIRRKAMDLQVAMCDPQNVQVWYGYGAGLRLRCFSGTMTDEVLGNRAGCFAWWHMCPLHLQHTWPDTWPSHVFL